MVNFDKNEVEEVLKEIEHPEIAYTLFDLGMIENVKLENNVVKLTLKVPMLGVPILDYLIASIKESIKEKFPGLEVDIDVAEMNIEERERFMRMAREAWRG